MQYFDISTIKSAIKSLQVISPNWLIPPFVFAANDVGIKDFVNLSKKRRGLPRAVILNNYATAGSGERWSCAMTDFDSVSTSTYQPGSFALHCSPAGRTDRWALLLHARKFGRSPSYDIRHSARRVLQALPGLLYLTAYPNPLKSIARMLSQRHVNSRQSARSGSAGVVSVELARRKARRDASSWRGRPPSLESF